MAASEQDRARIGEAARAGRAVMYRVILKSIIYDVTVIVRPELVEPTGFRGRLLWFREDDGTEVLHQLGIGTWIYHDDIDADSVAFVFPRVRRLIGDAGTRG